MRIVGLIGMRQHAVDHGGFNGAAEDVRADDGRGLFAGVSFRHRERYAAGRQFATGDHRSQRIQSVMLGFLDHFFGKRTVRGAGHVIAEL